MQLFSEAYNARNLKERINGAGLSLAEQLFGHPGKRAGSGIQYSHPHMEQRTPSFTVYPSGSFKDYKTGEHGNVFDLIMLVTGCRFPEACNYVAQFVGVSAVTQDFQPVKSTPRPVQRSLEQSEQWRDAAEKLVTDAQRKLWNGSTESTHVLNYLHGRGLTDASIRSGGFGYVSTWTPSAFWDENGKRANLAPGIIIPWRDPAGKLTNIRIRRRVGTLARALGMIVQPVVAETLPGGQGYRVRFLAPWTSFPSDDALADTAAMNRWIETEIRANPAQYLWVHKRFKTRPPGAPPIY